VSGYLVPAGVYRTEEVIRRSRFIVTVAHAESVSQAQAQIAAVREEFADATHNCWAWQLGPPGDTAQVRASDDGEPAGTAGRPMLGVLVASAVGEVVAVVTRYFGGIKLGAGGLVRAYSGVLARAMGSLPTVEKVRWQRLVLTLDYPQISAFYRALPGWGAQLVAEDCGLRAQMTILAPEGMAPAIAAWVQEVSAGAGEVRIADEEE